MQLPTTLYRAVEELLEAQRPDELSRAAADLSQRYRAGRIDGGRPVHSPAHRAAYTAFRLPATYAAAHAVLAETARRIDPNACASFLDLGAGPGTASWAAAELFDSLSEMTLAERDPDWISLGERLARQAPIPALAQARWRHIDLSAAEPLPAADLVIACYSLGELTESAGQAALARAWDAAATALVLIEPGTPAGFGRIRRWRDALVDRGAQLAAPCPHADACPVPEGDWCHFSARVERSSLHRRIKGGSLGHEDEKFSYLVVTKEPAVPAGARVVRHPQKRGGHTNLALCTADGLEKHTLSRRDKATWKRAAKLSWGDAWDA